MGGFNIGELFAALKLDDSQFLEAVQRTVGAEKLLKMDTEALGGSFQNLILQLSKAGASIDPLVNKLSEYHRIMEKINAIQASASKMGLPGLGLGSVGSSSANPAEKVVEETVEKMREAQTRLAKIEEDGNRRRLLDIGNQKKAQDEYYSDIMGMESNYQSKLREETDLIRAKEKALSDAYQAHWRTNQLASGLTQVGTTAAAAGGGILAGAGFMAKDAADFQDAMAKSLAIVGQVSDALKNQMGNAAREAAKETGLSAKSLAEDFGVLAKSGMDAAHAVELLPQHAKFAVANNTELHESTRQVVTIMESLKLVSGSETKVMDELTLANQLARGSVDQLATALEGRAGAALRSAGVSLEQALALTISFSKAGVTASQSQTFLAQVISQLQAKALSAGNEIVYLGNKQARFRDIVYDSAGNTRNFVDILKDLDTAFKGQSAAKIGAFFEDIHLGTSRGSQALKILLSQSDLLEALTDRLGKAGGTMNTVFGDQMKSPLRQLDQLKAQLTDLAITLGIPIVAGLQAVAREAKPAFEAVSNMAKWFGELNPVLQQFIVGAGVGAGGLALIGGTALIAAGHILSIMANLKLLQQTGVFADLSLSAGGLAAKFGLIGIAVAALTAALYGVKKAKDEWLKSNDTSTFALGAGLDLAMSPMSWATGAYSKLGGGSKSPATDTKSSEGSNTKSLDEFRKMLDGMKDAWKGFMDGGALAIDPKKIINQQVMEESFQTMYTRFMTEYDKVADKLTQSEAKTIDESLHSFVSMVTKGADPKLIRSAFSRMEAEFDDFKSNAEQRTKKTAEEVADNLKMENATANLERFVEKYSSTLGSGYTVIEAWIASLRIAEQVGDSAGVESGLKGLELMYKAITDQMKVATQTQNELARASNEYMRANHKDITHAREDVSVSNESRIAPGFVDAFKQVAALSPQFTQVQSAMKGIGAVSQYSLDLAAASAKSYYAELVNLGAGSYDLKAAAVKMWEAIASAQHVAVEQLGGDASKYYQLFKEQVMNSVTSAHREWIQSLRTLKQDVKRVMGDVAGGLVDSLFPQVNTTNPLAPIVTAFRDAFNQLAVYSDPKSALEKVIMSIQTAGSVAQANAISVKYFGETMGPQLARELRNGTISAGDIKKAIDQASLSTVEYEQKSNKSVKSVAAIFKEAMRDIEVSITKYAIEQGIVSLLKFMFQLETKSRDLSVVLKGVWGSISKSVGGIFGGGSGGGGGSVYDNLPLSHGSPTGLGGIASIPTWNGGSVPLGGSMGGAPTSIGGGAGSATSSFGSIMGIAGAIGSVGTMISSIVGNFQQAKMETTMNAIEHNTRYLEILFEQHLQSIMWPMKINSDYMVELLRDISSHTYDSLVKGMGGGSVSGFASDVLEGIRYNCSLIVSKFDESVIPSLNQMVAVMTNGGVMMAGAGGGGGGVTINGNVSVSANNPDQFVRRLKSQRVVRGISG